MALQLIPPTEGSTRQKYPRKFKLRPMMIVSVCFGENLVCLVDAMMGLVSSPEFVIEDILVMIDKVTRKSCNRTNMHSYLDNAVVLARTTSVRASSTPMALSRLSFPTISLSIRFRKGLCARETAICFRYFQPIIRIFVLGPLRLNSHEPEWGLHYSLSLSLYDGRNRCWNDAV